MQPLVLSVSELNRRVRDLLHRNLPLQWVAGEISNLTRAASGHVYFSLKDSAAQVRCVMFRNRAQLLPWRLENGQQVEVQASVTLYEARGDYQLNIEALRRAGLGQLFEAYTRLRLQLEGEGLFSAERKRALPLRPCAIGIVTSPQAAALHDILTTLWRRAPHLDLVLYPAPVQGEGSAGKLAQSIAQAGARASADGVELLILARGGGSIEDLWAFNEEVLARAMAACPLPIISGVGHETDVTIADFVADQRAATPTAAAELATAGWWAARTELVQLRQQLAYHARRQLEARMQRLDNLAQRLLHPGQRLQAHRQQLRYMELGLAAAGRQRLNNEHQRLERLRLRHLRQRPQLADEQRRLQLAGQRLQTALQRHLAQQRSHVAQLAATLAPLNPMATLARGYSIVRDAQGRVVRSSQQLQPGDSLAVDFAQGQAGVRVERLE